MASSSKTASYTLSNWQRAQSGVSPREIVEATLFTDSRVTGEVTDLGPYSFLNTIAHASLSSALRPAVVLRMVHHYVPEADPSYRMPMQNDFEHYHGGDAFDEMAALASLSLGIRLKAGGANREFRHEQDRFGRPIRYGSKPDPQLVLEGRTQIPRLMLPVNLNAGLAPLGTFPKRTSGQTNALIKSARQYQQAIWIADADPSLAWLMLVSAVETAALEWSAGDASPIEQLEIGFPELVEMIQKSGNPELLLPIADMLSQLTKSTKRFVDFLQAFVPPPPPVRAEEWMQFSYDPANMKKALGLIYNHRSKSLHSGTAFPLPMCEVPRYEKHGDESVAVQEKPFGLATSSLNASWKVEKTPMLLNTFEHLVRGALLNWWASLAPRRLNIDPSGCEPSQPD